MKEITLQLITLFISLWQYQVSYGSELSNRGPTFDMDLSDFMDEGQPISYEKAKRYFSQDPSQKWVIFLSFFSTVWFLFSR